MFQEVSSGLRAPTPTRQLRRAKPSRHAFPDLPRTPLVLVCDSLRHASSAGNVLRLADAFLLEKVWLCGDTAMPGSPKMRRSTKGVERWVPWELAEDPLPVVQRYREAGYGVVCLELAETSVSPYEARLPMPACLVLGNERRGVDPRILDLADVILELPSQGMGNSMNVGSAAAISIFEICRQARVRGDAHGA